ncbi:MAG: hypothetical protein ACRCXL_06905 [Dermatophilaceae bacterium]
MPTSRPRHQVTETPDVAHALDLAARRWPREPRSRLLLPQVEAGSRAVEEERIIAAQRRQSVIDATSGRYADAFPDDYLTALHRDWPE